MSLQPRQIEAFRAVLQTGSMTAAADFLQVTQPAVSRLIRELETFLGMPLFRRVGNRITPTQSALLLQPEIERHFIGLDRIERAAAEVREARKGTIRIAANAALSIGVLNPALRDFLTARPGVSIRLHTDNSENIVRLVAMHRADIGFVRPVRDTPGVRIQMLPEADAICILPSRHSLAKRKVIRCRDLQGQRFLSLGRDSSLRQRLDALLLSYDVRCAVILESSLAASISRLVSMGLGVAIIDPFDVYLACPPGVVVRPFLPRLPVRHACLLPAHQIQHRLVAELQAAVVRQMRAVADWCEDRLSAVVPVDLP